MHTDIKKLLRDRHAHATRMMEVAPSEEIHSRARGAAIEVVEIAGRLGIELSEEPFPESLWDLVLGAAQSGSVEGKFNAGGDGTGWACLTAGGVRYRVDLSLIEEDEEDGDG